MRSSQKGTLLFNPVGMIHLNRIAQIRPYFHEWKLRCLLEPALAWFSSENDYGIETYYFKDGFPPKEAFDDVAAVILFSAQPRVASCSLVQMATRIGIPVIAIEEVYQMMLEQGYVNGYFLPVDHLFAASEYERKRFLETGMSPESVENRGYLFHRAAAKKEGASVKEPLLRKWNLSAHRPVATLCLADLTPSGETRQVRKDLLTMLAEGLPPEYQLLIKPHPAEMDREVRGFIHYYAPQARITDPDAPIDEVLNTTDILFNRGNSQVVMDALERGIPAVAVPLGRRIFFEGFLDDVVARTKEDICGILKRIKEKGMSIYASLIDGYLNADSHDLLCRAAERINEIALGSEQNKPPERLMELGVFWAWMGYSKQSFRTLSCITGLGGKQDLLVEALRHLVCHSADDNDLQYLKRWAGSGYREWILQSLWIQQFYLAGGKMRHQEIEWFKSFPPRMNREYFLPFAYMLYWCYRKSGFYQQAQALQGRLNAEYGASFQEHKVLRGVEKLNQASASEGRYYIDPAYWDMRIHYRIKTGLKNILLELVNLKNCTAMS